MDGMGFTSIHLVRQSTATTKKRLPSSSGGNGPAKSILHPLPGKLGRWVALYASLGGCPIYSVWHAGQDCRTFSTVLLIWGHHQTVFKLCRSLSRPSCPMLSWVSWVIWWRCCVGGMDAHLWVPGRPGIWGKRFWSSTPLALYSSASRCIRYTSYGLAGRTPLKR